MHLLIHNFCPQQLRPHIGICANATCMDDDPRRSSIELEYPSVALADNSMTTSNHGILDAKCVDLYPACIPNPVIKHLDDYEKVRWCIAKRRLSSAVILKAILEWTQHNRSGRHILV